MEEGKIFLAKNFIFHFNEDTSNYYLDYNFLEKHTPSSTWQDLKENLSKETGLQQLQEDILKHHKNPPIGYLNINSLRNEITDLRVIMKTLPLDYLTFSETNGHESFPTAQFNIEVMKSELGIIEVNTTGGLIEFVQRGLICKKLRDYEPNHSKYLCFELTFTNKKWICFSIYRPPESSNLPMFLEELTKSLNKVLLKYKNSFDYGWFWYRREKQKLRVW